MCALERAGAQKQLSPARREFLAVFPPCHMFWGDLIFFLFLQRNKVAQAPSLPGELGESPQARAGDWEAELLHPVHCSRTQERRTQLTNSLSQALHCLSFPTDSWKVVYQAASYRGNEFMQQSNSCTPLMGAELCLR